jgi:hypothetical protein
MKKALVLIILITTFGGVAQEHFSGIGTSQRVGILNGNINPAEFALLDSAVEVNFFGTSVNVSNNKIGFSDLTGSNIEELIFRGNEPVNMRFDIEVAGPGVAFKIQKWGFAVTSKAHGTLNLIDVDVNLGDAIANNGLNALLNTTTLDGNDNQRLMATTFGELGLSAARTLWDTDKYLLTGGATLKLLFPGSFANFGVDQFQGTINTAAGNSFLTNTNAAVNIAYSGNLGSSFSDFDSYRNSIFGGLKGMAFDFGGNFIIKDDQGGFKLKTGLSIRNLGSMTFSDANNSTTNYAFAITGNQSLDLNQFQDVDSLQEVEQILLDSGYLTAIRSNRDFKVRLPGVINAYADLKIIPTLYLSLFVQQKLTNDSNNDQVTAQNLISLTPRFSLKNFELFAPISQNEISGFNAGFGLRAWGFYMGSGSLLTAVINDSKQADVFFGYRLGIGKN